MIRKLADMEERIKNWIKRHLTFLYLAAITILGGGIRFFLRGYISGDMTQCLLPWMESIREAGGLQSLRLEIGNYNPPYMIILTLLSYIPLYEVFLIKLPSILFDFLLASCAAFYVWRHLEKKSEAIFLYSVLLLDPIVILNSSYWGQCDVIYTFFLVLCILFLLREKYFMAFLLFGCGYAFKQQAAFLLPVLVLLYMQKKKLSILHFLLIPVVDLFLCLPSLLAGRPIGDIVSVYAGQTDLFKNMTMLYYNIWYLFPVSYEDFFAAGCAFAITVLGTGAYWVLKKQISLDGHRLLYFAIWVMYTCLMFFPAMHDRYGYAMEICFVLYAVLYRRKIGVCIMVCLVTLAAYTQYFLRTPVFPEAALAVVNLACYLKLSYDGLRYTCKKSGETI